MSVDYRGLRLVEQVLEAEERRDTYTHNDTFHEVAKADFIRLFDLLCDWVAFSAAHCSSRDSAQDKANELLKTFRA